ARCLDERQYTFSQGGAQGACLLVFASSRPTSSKRLINGFSTPFGARACLRSQSAQAKQHWTMARGAATIGRMVIHVAYLDTEHRLQRQQVNGCVPLRHTDGRPITAGDDRLSRYRVTHVSLVFG